jgi:sugar O-acyltransferase (sialic acid O-acetyltransferase NeuD family)
MIIVGAIGFAKQLIEIFHQKKETKDLFFFDDISKNENESLFGFKIIKNLDDAMRIFRHVSNDFCLGIGGPQLRQTLCDKFEEMGGNLSTVISPFSHISTFVRNIGKGATILTGVIIENDATIGEGSLINVNSVVHHDVEVGNFCEISPGAKLLGGVRLGTKCVVGTNAVILPKVCIGDNVVIGAGAVVTKDINSNATVVGIPAKLIKKNG